MSAVQAWKRMFPFDGLGGAEEAQAAAIESTLASQSIEYIETWLPTALTAAVAFGVSADRIKQIYCKIAPALAMNPKIQAAFAAYAAGGCANNPALPPLQPEKTNWALWIGISVGALALIGGAIWYVKRRR